jgi:hypothetical protein
MNANERKCKTQEFVYDADPVREAFVNRYYDMRSEESYSRLFAFIRGLK